MNHHKLTTRRLARLLADIAWRIRETDGDFAAQASVYFAFARRWNGCGPEIVGRRASREAETLLDGIDLAAVFARDLAEGKDPAIYFHEHFLRAYNPAGAKSRGVHYSPPAVVSYILRGVEELLRDELGARPEDAIALDPCCGTGAFIRAIDGPYCRVMGMELSAIACAIASSLMPHREILNMDSLEDTDLDLRGRPLVVIGNPPYSGHSSNTGAISELLADYKTGLRERNPKWLQDDYVKFIRMAQHRVERAGRGIVGFITNHSFLFNPTFRAMRASLMNGFDRIYCLNLHGNFRVNESARGSEPDENVFPIQMGTAITFMVRSTGGPGCQINYAEIRGSRAHKLAMLDSLTLRDTPWEEPRPEEPFMLFMPVDHDLRREFYSFPSLFDIFGCHSVGFVTSRDSFAVDFDREALLQRIADLRNPDIAPELICERYDVTDLDIPKASRMLQADLNWQDRAVEVLYRPFDRRWAYLSNAVMERPRLPFMHSFLGRNIALAIGRAGQVTGSDTWDVVFCTDCPTDLNLFRRGGAMLFPLYLVEDGVSTLNFKPGVPGDERLFHYIYAVLHGNEYRTKYSEFLKMDYPRIPIPADEHLIDELAEKGRALAKVHLMRDVSPDITSASAADPSTRIGGWPAPGKYLSDRRHRHLTQQEQAHLSRIREAVINTEQIRREIDNIMQHSLPPLLG
jgi:predicted helicase